MAEWTPTMQAMLEAGWNAGDTTSAIAERVGVTKNAVIGRARRSPNCIARQNPIIKGSKRPNRAPVRRRSEEPNQKREPGTGLLIGPTLPPMTLPTLRLVAAISVHGPRACCWPFGDPRKPDFRFCGEPVAERSYCAEHLERAYVKTRRQEIADAA